MGNGMAGWMAPGHRTDNAAMMGAAGYVAYQHGLFGGFDDAADPSMLMPGEEDGI